MASYILRKIDEALWQRVKAKAARQIPNESVKSVIERLLAQWLNAGNETK